MAISSSNIGQLGGAVSEIFGGASSIISAGGYKAAQRAYEKSAEIYADQGKLYDQMGVQSGANAKIADAGSRIKQMQTEREVLTTLSGQKADIAGTGLASSGSALDIIRSSAQQGALDVALGRISGELEQAGYREEQLSYQAMGKASQAAAAAATGQAGAAGAQATAAKVSGGGGILGGLLKGASAVASIAGLFSDYRLKSNIIFLDADRGDGINHYLFCYNGSTEVFLGVLAQEVQQVYPDAVSVDPSSGFLKVDYAAIGETMYHVGSA